VILRKLNVTNQVGAADTVKADPMKREMKRQRIRIVKKWIESGGSKTV
jgi:predicted phage tail protein